MRAWGARLGLAVLLTLGLLGWELCLLELLSGGFGVRASTVAPRLARDALLLFPLWVLALWATRPGARSEGEVRTVVEKAAALSLCFGVLLLPVAAGRAVFQRLSPPASSSGATKDRPTSATARTLEADGRFVCAAVSADESANDSGPDSGSLLATAGTGARAALLLQVPVFPLALWVLSRRRSRFSVAPARAATAVLAVLLPLGLLLAWGSDEGHSSARESPLQEELEGCRPGAPVRTYAVAAIPVDLPLNAHGDHVPQGFMYVLEEELPAVREQERRPWPERAARGLHDEPIQPLVLRANLGECLRVHFTNRLGTGSASLRIEGLPATVSARGQARGFVPGTSVPPGQGLTYVFSLPESASAEGLYLLHDSEEGGGREARGLFGALVLEPAGAVYRDASTGGPLRHGTGWEALIEAPSGEGFRELVLLYHAMGAPEVADVRSAKGVPLPLLDEMAGPFRAGAHGVNYRSEPRFEREEPSDEDGEPRAVRTRELATPPLRSYLGEPVKLRVAQAGSAELHVHHLHGGSELRGGLLREAPGTPAETPRLLSPGRGLTLSLGGPGDFPQKAGDFLVHCHVPNHFTGGERLSWHVFSAPQPGLAPLPVRAP
ncbi:cupredoxin [Archangium sp.]|uniref:cupredoxin n=1 Tax=Archangium sp. TaxID=1872627 RepID=UPI00389AE2A3